MLTDTTSNTAKQNIVVTRVIGAPPEQVWKSWTRPELIMQWWGPRSYTSPSCEIDLREGGRYVFCMRAPEEQGGSAHYTAGTYQKIIPLEMVEFTSGMADKNGNKIDPVQVGMPPDFPDEIRTIVTFKELVEGVTEVTITEHDWGVGPMSVFSLIGWHQSMDKLAASLT
jgi:uncharacterized protein YndB with AHSA1/START domain